MVWHVRQLETLQREAGRLEPVVMTGDAGTDAWRIRRGRVDILMTTARGAPVNEHDTITTQAGARFHDPTSHAICSAQVRSAGF
jgi:hypothetical protein